MTVEDVGVARKKEAIATARRRVTEQMGGEPQRETGQTALHRQHILIILRQYVILKREDVMPWSLVSRAIVSDA